MSGWPTHGQVVEAAGRIRELAIRTPLVPSLALSAVTRAEVRLKLETTQPTRAFKIRGAANVILHHEAIDPAKGVVTYSTGNHGRAVAYVASRLGLPATVCVSRNTTGDKRRSLAAIGATVEVVGESQGEAAVRARELAGQGLLLVDPIDDPLTTAGQGTIGLEIVEDWPDVDTVLVPVSGGALIAGVALAVKALQPAARVIGVSMERGAAMFASLEAGHPVEVDEVESLADSLQGGIGLANTHSFAMVRELVDEIILVSEDEIAVAMAEAVIAERLILEGAGAAPIAALLSEDRKRFGDRIAVVASGAMVDDQILLKVVDEHRETVAALLERGEA